MLFRSAILAFLALATSLHIGAMYSAMLWGYSAMRFKSDGWPWGPACLMVLLPIGFATGIIVFSPTAWRGFQENLLATASFTAFRFPSGYDVLKVIRNVPGLLIVTAFLAADLARGRRIFRSDLPNSYVVPVFITILAAADYCEIGRAHV